MNFALKVGCRALILMPERPNLVGRSGQLIRKIEENLLMLVEGNAWACFELDSNRENHYPACAGFRRTEIR